MLDMNIVTAVDKKFAAAMYKARLYNRLNRCCKCHWYNSDGKIYNSSHENAGVTFDISLFCLQEESFEIVLLDDFIKGIL